MNAWMLPAMPWLIGVQWSRMWWLAVAKVATSPLPMPSATVIPFPSGSTAARRA